MEVFQYENGLDGHGLQVRQGLHGVGGVVHGRSRGGAGIGSNRREDGSRQPISFAIALRNQAARRNRLGSGPAAAGTDQAVGDGPFKDRQTELGAGGAHKS